MQLGNGVSKPDLAFLASKIMKPLILGYFWSLPSGVSPRLEWVDARALCSRAVVAGSPAPRGRCRLSTPHLQEPPGETEGSG